MDRPQPIIAPSILAADYSRLGSQIGECDNADAQWIHCDIMDGHFVPNISFGPAVVRAAASSTEAFIDVHLMIEHPDRYLQSFVEAGANQITVHQEVCPHLHRTVQTIRQQGLSAGVAINPATPLSAIEPILTEVNLVLLMSVNPGFGGQSFIESTYQRLRELVALRTEHQVHFLIEVDGGVNSSNITEVSRAGADVLVAGSAVFKADDIPSAIRELTQKAELGTGTIV